MGLPERHDHVVDEQAAQPAGAPVGRSPRTGEGNAALQRFATGPAPPHAAGFGVLAGGASAGGGGHDAGGNRALARLAVQAKLRPQAKLTVSRPGDPLERQADAVADAVAGGETVPLPTVSRLVSPAAAADEPPEVLSGIEELIASPGAGAPIPAEARARIEERLGQPLDGVRVHDDTRAQRAAAQLGARAFTTGRHIFLGPGEAASDLALMAHEATHVVQQQAVGVYRSHLQRDAADYLMGPVRDLVRSVPGYDMLTVVAGYDPVMDRTVDRGPENLARGVLGLVPFGNVVAGKLIELGVVQGAYRLLDDGLRAHNLTLDRIRAEMDQAWKEVDLTDPDGALTIVKRHVGGLHADALAFVRGVLDQIVQLIRDAAVGLAEKYLVGTPAWELVKKVLHQDPLRGTPVAATTVEIITDFLKLIGKEDALKQMQERGTLQKTADWLDARIAQFMGLLGELGALFTAGWAAIQPENLASLPDNLSRLANQAIGLTGRVGAFAKDVLTEVVRLIKDALLEWLSREATSMRGFRLLTVLLGEDPFTGRAVARTAENLIGGFVALLPNGEATYKKLAEAGVIAQAATQIEGAAARLGITPDLIIGTFKGIWDSLTLEDLVNPIGAFVRILEKFGEPLGRIVEFAGEVLKVVITLILKLMNFPPDIFGSIVTNAMAAIEDIQKDPVAFLLNMLQALKQGFLGFVDRAVGYLLTGLADWIFRGLGAIGVRKPPDLTFGSILTMVLQVLDITTEKLWKKLGEHTDPAIVEKIRGGLAMAEGAFDFIKDVQEGGVGAIWKHVESQLGNLWDSLLGMVKDWIVTEIVEKATAKLISMLDPTGIMAVVNSSIAFFKAVQSVIEYVRELLMIVNDYVTTLAAVAAGNISAGAQKVEKGLASAVPVAIGFLANQVGLGDVPEQLVEIIGKARTFVDEALDWLFAKAVQLGKSALAMLGLGPADGPDAEPPITIHEEFDEEADHEHHTLTSDKGGKNLVAHSAVVPISTIQDPEIQELAKKYYSQVDTYDQVRKATKAGTAEAVKGGATQAKKDVNTTIGQIVARLKVLGIDDAPGADSPGLGEVRAYSAQTSRVSQALTWKLEAEHVVPNGYLNAILDGMELRRISRSGEYRQMDTVLIYKGAADRKTHGEPPDEGDLATINVLKDWARQRLHEIQGDDTKLSGEDFSPVEDWRMEFEKFRSQFAGRSEIVQDNTIEVMRLEQQENGHKRGHPQNDTSLIDTLAPKVKQAKDGQLALFNRLFIDRLADRAG